jgi:hypothetical protein
LEISENTFLYITTGSFGSGGGGGGGGFFYKADFAWGFISASGAVGEGCNPTVIPTLRTATMLCGDGLYTQTVVVQPPSQIDIDRPLFHRPLPPPPPKPPLDRQTDGRSELIYKIDGDMTKDGMDVLGCPKDISSLGMSILATLL